MDIIEKTISNLVESQFPSFYVEEGPLFVEFAKKYYEWMETEYCILNEKQSLGSVSVSIGNNVVIGFNTAFEEKFSNVEMLDTMGNVIQCPRIAIFKEDESEYVWYNIDSISNNTHMILKSTPVFGGNNLSYGTTKRQKNPIYHSRHFYEYKDVDETVEQFLLFFKEKYLKDIRFETQTNTRQLIKHALDIYRAKGTERALDLLFRLVFGVGADVYYPGEDIFKLSDGKWYVPRYLEVTLSDSNAKFSGKQIRGVNSGAVAFVESVIRRNVKGKLIDILYISAIRGNFETGEIILSNGSTNGERIRIIGSLTDIQISEQGIGIGYSVGDIVDVISPRGEKGKIRVANVSNISGIVSYELINGGWGFTSNSKVIVSDKVLTVSNVTVSNTDVNNYFQLFESLVQPKAYVNFNSANAEFSNGELVYAYHPNNAVRGSGKILLANQSSNNGVLTVAVYSGDLNSASIYTTSNTKTATVNTATNGYYDITTSANVMGVSSNLVFYVTNSSVSLSRNDIIYQLDNLDREIANARITTFSRTLGTNAIIRTANVNGIFDRSKNLYSRNTNTILSIDKYDINLGVYEIEGILDFTTLEGNFVYSTEFNTNGYISAIGSGSLANLSISNDFIYEQNVILNNDYLLDYANVDLANSNYGFPRVGSETLSTVLIDALTFNQYNMGKIQYLTQINPGQNYSLPPFVTVFEQLSYIEKKQDIILTLDGQYNFAIGELVIQDSSGATGIVTDKSNNTVLVLERLFLKSNNFTVSTNELSKIKGEKSGTSANVSFVDVNNESKFLGLNAQIDTETLQGNGAITALEVVDSGFGYSQNEEITIENKNGQAVGIAKLGRSGRGQGYYKRKGGFLSDQKKLFDGLYYQEYSYDILSSVALNKYEDMLKKLLHVAGTKYFSSLVYSSTVNSIATFVNSNEPTVTIQTPAVIITEDEDNFVFTENENLISREI